MFSKRVSMDKGRVALVEKKVSTIVDKLLENKSENNTKIVINSSTQDVLLVDNDSQISVCLEHSGVKIANHDFLFYENLPLKFVENMKSKVLKEHSNRFKVLKKELFKNEVDLLDKIINDYV